MAVEKARREPCPEQVADRMGVDESALSRIMNGQGNLSLKTIGEFSWAVGLRPDIVFAKNRRDGPAGNPSDHEDKTENELR